MTEEKKLSKPYIVKQKDTWYIKEQLGEMDPVVICLCNSEQMAERVLKALLAQEQKQNG